MRSAPGYPTRPQTPLVDGLTKAEIVLKFGAKVRLIATILARKFPHSVDRDDLISVGMIGLMDAAEKFDASRGIKFSTYSEFRIRGAILDEIRNQDWVPRRVRDQAKKLEEIHYVLEFTLGRKPTDLELAKALGLSTEAYHELKNTAGVLTMVHCDDVEAVDEADPLAWMDQKAAKKTVELLLSQLSEHERVVIHGYYFRGLKLSEIAHILSLSGARISQIHSKAILKLKELSKAEVPDVHSLFVTLLDR